MYTITCPCGKDVNFTAKSKLGRKKFCSKKCQYKHATRPSGLTYKLVKKNPTSFKKGQKPWNKGVESKKQPGWKGRKASLSSKHTTIENKLGKPKKCEICKTTDPHKLYQWSNKDHKYSRNKLSDWQRLCARCHIKYDYEKFGTRSKMFEK